MNREEFQELMCEISVDGRDAEAASEQGTHHSPYDSAKLHEQAMAEYDRLTADLAQARDQLSMAQSRIVEAITDESRDADTIDALRAENERLRDLITSALVLVGNHAIPECGCRSHRPYNEWMIAARAALEVKP